MSSRQHNYSQHFLSSPNLVSELVGHSNIRKNDTVLDLGAGSGVITSVLARRAGKVIAVEVEPSALDKLRKNMSSSPNVSIVDADIMNVKLPNTAYKVFSNIPFSMSSDIVRRLTSQQSPPKSIYLIVQRQFAQKLVPSSQRFTSQLGAEIAPWWQVRVRRPLQRSDFTPPPAVDTVLIEIKPRSTVLINTDQRAAYARFIEKCYTRQKIFAKLPRQQAGISSERKPSEVTPEQWVTLYKITKGKY